MKQHICIDQFLHPHFTSLVVASASRLTHPEPAFVPRGSGCGGNRLLRTKPQHFRQSSYLYDPEKSVPTSLPGRRFAELPRGDDQLKEMSPKVSDADDVEDCEDVGEGDGGDGGGEDDGDGERACMQREGTG